MTLECIPVGQWGHSHIVYCLSLHMFLCVYLECALDEVKWFHGFMCDKHSFLRPRFKV